MQQRSSIKELEEHDSYVSSCFSSLLLPPGTLFRLYSRHYAAWGIQITEENIGYLTNASKASYESDWRMSTSAVDNAIADALRRADFVQDSYTLNQFIAEVAAEAILSFYAQDKPPDEIIIVDIGAGIGSTSQAMALQLLKRANMGEYDYAELARRCRLYLVEPSFERLTKAARVMEDQGIRAHAIHEDIDFFLGHTMQAHLIITNAVLHHLSFPNYLSRLRERLVDDGALVIGDFYNRLWEHPALIVPTFIDLGATNKEIREFEYYFGIKPETRVELERSMSKEDREAVVYMRGFVSYLAKKMAAVKGSHLSLFEAHTSIEERLNCLNRYGFETRTSELLEKYRGFASMKSDFSRGKGNAVINVYEKHNSAAVIAATKRKAL